MRFIAFFAAYLIFRVQTKNSKPRNLETSSRFEFQEKKSFRALIYSAVSVFGPLTLPLRYRYVTSFVTSFVTSSLPLRYLTVTVPLLHRYRTVTSQLPKLASVLGFVIF